MSIVKLDLVLVGELRPVVSVVLLVAADDVLERSSTEEVLLLQSQLFTAGSGVVGVEDAGDVFCGLPLGDGAKVVSRVERVEVELVAAEEDPVRPRWPTPLKENNSELKPGSALDFSFLPMVGKPQTGILSLNKCINCLLEVVVRLAAPVRALPQLVRRRERYLHLLQLVEGPLLFSER